MNTNRNIPHTTNNILPRGQRHVPYYTTVTGRSAAPQNPWKRSRKYKNYELPPYTRLDLDQTGKGLLHTVFILFLGIVLIRVLTRGLDNIPTFTSLLDALSGAPSIPFDWLDVFNFSLADMFPVGLQWLGSLFDFFVDCFRAGMFVGTAVVNIFPFFFYFIQWVFV